MSLQSAQCTEVVCELFRAKCKLGVWTCYSKKLATNVCFLTALEFLEFWEFCAKGFTDNILSFDLHLPILEIHENQRSKEKLVL